MIDHPQSAYAEAVHALYTQVCLAAPGQPPRAAILVTSASPAKARASLAASLAVFAVQLGHWALLVDSILRRPAVARKFKARPPADALAVLTGAASFEDAVVRDLHTGVDLLAAGEGHENPITLLTSGVCQRSCARHASSTIT